jgi:dipeptide/tripeptide permease
MERILKFFKSLTDFNRSFWSANISELFERIAFYGMTSFLVIYLTEVRGIAESDAIGLNGNFGLVVYGLPVLSGFLADWMGFRRAIMMAYAFLAVGYFLAGQFTTYWTIAGALLLVAFGASLIKPCITGTVQKTSPAALGAVGFSIYYTLVNIGGFLAPNTHGWVAESFGVERVFMASSGVIVLALLLIFFAFREPVVEGEEKEKKSLGSFLRDFLTVVRNGRLMLLFLFVAGFWSMFFQFFGALPLYLRTDLGVESERVIGFIISLDALTIVIFQVIVGYLVRNIRTDKAVLLGVAISSVGILFMATHAAVVVVGIGIAVFAVGEMTYSAHFYKYLGDMAPKEQVGMYMGFAFLPIAVGSWLSGVIGGPILHTARETLGNPQMMWVFFGGVGIVSALGIALLTFVFPPKQTAQKES